MPENNEQPSTDVRQPEGTARSHVDGRPQAVADEARQQLDSRISSLEARMSELEAQLMNDDSPPDENLNEQPPSNARRQTGNTVHGQISTSNTGG